jgi:uncharacterized membrane protein YvlD (DUF360 family)
VKVQLKDLAVPLLLTLALLFVLEIFATTVLPIIGLHRYVIPFNILIVLYMGFKLQTPYLAILIFIVQYFHHFFTVEGWEMGTVAGVVICLLISYLRDVIHFSSAAMTVFVTQVFQCVWFFIVSLLLYSKLGDMSFILDKFWRFIPESIIISLMAPFFFSILDKFWTGSDEASLGEGL